MTILAGVMLGEGVGVGDATPVGVAVLLVLTPLAKSLAAAGVFSTDTS
jgi:hypothetical protein